MHSFFVGPGLEPGAEGLLSPEESAHAARVLRLRPGEEVRLIDGAGRAFVGELISVAEKETRFAIRETVPSREPAVRLTLYQGLPKADKLEWIVQKLTELGAARIVPVETRYSVAKAKPGKDARLVRIAREAVKQCGRAACPEIAAPMRFADAVEDMRRHERMLMPWEAARAATLAQVLEERPQARDIGVFIGPEGGIAAEEAEAAQAAGAVAVTLGERILRTETAAVAAAAVVFAILG